MFAVLEQIVISMQLDKEVRKEQEGKKYTLQLNKLRN